jgi:hypothetical protein
MCVCEFIVTIVGVTVGHPSSTGAVNKSAQKVLILFVCLYVLFFFNTIVSLLFISLPSHSYIAFFATSWGPVAWVVTGEIFVSLSRVIFSNNF